MIRLDFSGKLGPVERLPSGALKVPAYLTRTGIFTYQRSDGTKSRELRVPEEVFSEDAVNSFKGAPLTVGHPGRVTSDNWRRVAVGHINDDVQKKQDSAGEFLFAHVTVQDAITIGQIEKGELVELSCGYDCKVEEKPGRLDSGEEYDAIQRCIVGNHVAIGPKKWGRAGGNVRLYLDAKDAVAFGEEEPEEEMAGGEEEAEEEAPPPKKKKAKKALAEDAYTNSDMTVENKDKAPAEKVVPFSEYEKLQAERDALKAKCDSLSSELAGVDKKVAAAIELRTKASKLVGDSFDFAGKSDRDVLVAAILATDSGFKADGKSNDYLAARFDIAVESAGKSREALGALNQDAFAGSAGEESLIEKAKKKMLERNATAWKGHA